MTGSAFEAMDVVVALEIAKREEVWRRGGRNIGPDGHWGHFFGSSKSMAGAVF